MPYPTRTELSAMDAPALRTLVARIDEDLKTLHLDDDGELRTLTSDEQARFDELVQLREDAEAHARIRAVVAAGNPKAIEHFSYGSEFNTTRPQVDARDALKAPAESVRSSAVALAEHPYPRGGGEGHLTDAQKAAFAELVRQDSDSCDGSYIARRALVTESPEYRSAWAQAVTNPHPIFTAEEAAALRSLRDLDRQEYRAMAEGTTTAGGFGVPVFLDPTIIMSSQGSNNPFLQIARTVNVTTNIWKGVSSAGVSWSFDAEAAEVSDDSPTLAQPTVPVYMARGFIPFSIELGMDYPNFASEMATLLAEGYNELLAEKFCTGNGTSEPRGILTALAATASAQTNPTTDGSFGEVDIYKVWKALPERFRSNASWMMSVDVNNRIRQFGTNTNAAGFTVTLPAGAANIVLGSPVYTSSYFPDFTGTTGQASILVVGDFSNFVIAQRSGMAIELVPTLLGTTNNRPTGQRGWFSFARVGSNSVQDLGFRLLANT